MHMKVGALFGRFAWRWINICDVTIHLSRGSKDQSHKVCEHNRVTHASATDDVLLESMQYENEEDFGGRQFCLT